MNLYVIGGAYGRALEDVGAGSKFHVGDTVRVVFQSACPRNNVRRKTFLTVERLAAGDVPATGRPLLGAQSPDADWEVVATDDDWWTRFSWDRQAE